MTKAALVETTAATRTSCVCQLGQRLNQVVQHEVQRTQYQAQQEVKEVVYHSACQDNARPD